MFKINLTQAEVDKYFKPIRSKTDLIWVLIQAVKRLLIKYEPHAKDIKGQFTLEMGETCRASFHMEKKYFSIRFPFSIVDDGYGNFRIHFRNTLDLDSSTTSQILAILNEIKDGIDYYDFWSSIESNESERIGMWDAVFELLTFEDGYIRYDHDPDNQNGSIHPLDHLDLFYSNSSSIKIGLYTMPTIEDFRDIFHPETPCYFLHRK